MLWDTSDRKRAEMAQSEFISVVSHELRTPLTSIRGALCLLAAGVAEPLPPIASSLVDIAMRNSGSRRAHGRPDRFRDGGRRGDDVPRPAAGRARGSPVTYLRPSAAFARSNGEIRSTSA